MNSVAQPMQFNKASSEDTLNGKKKRDGSPVR